MSDVWLQLPPERAVYSGLSTDHYPWTEVYADLSARPQFSGVLEVEQDGLRGRFVWVDGELRGGYHPGGELGARSIPVSFPQATVSLTALDPALAQLIWACRDADRAALTIGWPDARDILAARRFRGALLGEHSCSYWEDGRLLTGSLPEAGEALSTVTPRPRYTQADLEAFWSEVMRASGSRVPIADAWRRAASNLADLHPCLDPFAREVWYDGQAVHVDPDLAIPELRAAMADLFRCMLALYGVALKSIPMPEARSHPLWPTSGLEE